MKRTLMSALLLLGIPFLHGAERPSYTASLAKVAPVLDGRLDDACWQNASVQDGLVHPQSGKPATQNTRFRIVCTAESLYVAAQCAEATPKAILARNADHDGSIWGDDCIEVFLSPADDGMEYVHVIANTLGAIFDAHVTQMGISSDTSFETGAKAVAQVGEDSWSIEIEIPFAGLGLKPGTGSNWGLNVARERKPKPGELSCWVHTEVEKFGVPAKFGQLRLPKLPFSQFSWRIGGFSLRNPQFKEEGVTDAELTCTARSLGASPGSVQLAVTAVQDDGEASTSAATITVASGAAGAGVVPLRLTGPIRSIRYRLTDAKTGTLLALGGEKVNLTCAPLALRLLAPWYRDTIFASAPIDTIEAAVTVHGSAARIEATLAREGTVLARQTVQAAPGQPAAVRLPAKGLAPGEYSLRVARADGSASATKTIRVLPRKQGEVCLDRQGRLLVDGKPWFAWGFFCSSPTERLAKAGFNTVVTYIGYYIHRDKDMKAWLDRCQELGIRAAMYPYMGEVGVHVNKKRKRFTDKELERTAQFVRLYKDHPAILGWYLCDEPRGTVYREEMKRVRDVVSAEDPYHPCIVLDNSGRGVAGLADAGEVLWVDPYPGFAKGGPPRLPMETVSIAMDDMIQGTGDRLRHFWSCPQAFNWGAWGGEKAKTERAPTYEEERTMTYLSIVHGAQGVVYFAWKYALKEPHLSEGFLTRLGPEMRDLVPELRDGKDVPDVVAETVPAESKIHLRAFRRGDRLTIVAVNPGPQSVTARIRLPNLAGSFDVISETRTVTTKAGVLADTFPPYGTHVYRSR